MYINFEDRKYIAYEENGALIVCFGDLRICKRYLKFLTEKKETFSNIVRIDGRATFATNCKIMRHVKKNNISKCIILVGGKRRHRTERNKKFGLLELVKQLMNVKIFDILFK